MFPMGKSTKGKIKVNPRSKCNDLYMMFVFFFFWLLKRHNFLMKNEKERSYVSVLHRSVSKECFTNFIHLQTPFPAHSFSLLFYGQTAVHLTHCRAAELTHYGSLFCSPISLNYLKGRCQVGKSISSKIKYFFLS